MTPLVRAVGFLSLLGPLKFVEEFFRKRSHRKHRRRRSRPSEFVSLPSEPHTLDLTDLDKKVGTRESLNTEFDPRQLDL